LLPGVTGRQVKNSGMKIRLLFLGANLVFGALLIAGVAFTISSVAAVSGTMAAYRQVNEGLPNAAGVAVDNFQTTRIFDRDGELLQEVDDPTNPYGGWRTFVTMDQISPYLIDATVASEDATFWTHYGVEPTVTQQLVRALFPEKIGNDISYSRKGKEALAAVELERQYSKNDIMTMYLNLIFYGNRSYGIEAASQTFFEKHASELTLPEAALLAGLPQRPTAYNPTLDLDLAKRRQQYVLDQMAKLGYITRAEAKQAWETPLNLREGQRTGLIANAPHFVTYVGGYVRRGVLPGRFADHDVYRYGIATGSREDCRGAGCRSRSLQRTQWLDGGDGPLEWRDLSDGRFGQLRRRDH
jgi:membrane peptidoglycan carboxypeptidase